MDKKPTRIEKYMGLAFFISAFSKDPNTQVGSVIVDMKKNEILGMGYNGPPASIDDNYPGCWSREPNSEGLSKYDLVNHAEHNSCKMARHRDLTGKTMFVTTFPCPVCMKDYIVGNNLKEVIYWDKPITDNKSSINQINIEKSRKIAGLGDVDLYGFNTAWLGNSLDWIARKVIDWQNLDIIIRQDEINGT